MHVHRTPVDLNVSNLYAAEAARKAADAKKAAEVRRKLLRASAGVGDESVDLESLAVSQRGGEHSGQDGETGYPDTSSAHPDKRRKASDEPPAMPLSVWA